MSSALPASADRHWTVGRMRAQSTLFCSFCSPLHARLQLLIACHSTLHSACVRVVRSVRARQMLHQASSPAQHACALLHPFRRPPSPWRRASARRCGCWTSSSRTARPSGARVTQALRLPMHADANTVVAAPTTQRAAVRAGHRGHIGAALHGAQHVHRRERNARWCAGSPRARAPPPET